MTIWICPDCGIRWNDSKYTNGENPKGVPWYTRMQDPVCKECSEKRKIK